MDKPTNPDPISEDEESALNNRKYVAINQQPAEIAKFNQEDFKYLSSEASWSDLGLDSSLSDRLIQLGYKRPSIIQYKVVTLSKSHSVVAQAQNGSGKTLAFIVPILRLLGQSKSVSTQNSTAAPQVVILADTRALILQIDKIINRICEGFKDYIIDYAFSGKTTVNPKTQIFITTIAQLRFAAQKKLADFSGTELIVVDEADHVFESDVAKSFFATFVQKLLKSPNFNVIFTSATMTDDFREAIKIVQEKRNLVSVELPVEQLTLTNVQQYFVAYTGFKDKKEILEQIISKINAQNILIFDNRKKDLLELLDFLNAKNYKAAFIYKNEGEQGAEINTADLIQRQIDDFLAGKYRILLTTNLLSRGIDMRKVTLVVNYSLPIKFKPEDGNRSKEVDLETYLHRVGRTGRFGDHGIAVNFVDAKYEIDMLKQITQFYKNEIRELKVEQVSTLNTALEEIQQWNTEKRIILEENI